jgi:phage/plasmid-associated DNA primase
MTKKVKYANADKHLYPNYLQYCYENGIKPLCRDEFIKEVLKTCKENGLDVYLEETKDGLAFVNLEIKSQAQADVEKQSGSKTKE